MGWQKSSENNRTLEPFGFDIRFHHGGRFETSANGQVAYVGGVLNLQFGFWSETYSYRNVLQAGLSLLNGKPFESFFKVRGKSFETGLKKLESPNGMTGLFNTRGDDNRLDVYFVETISPLSTHVMSKTMNTPEKSATLVRRSPRLLNSPIEISVSPLKRIEKLQPRRKLVLDDRECIGGNVSKTKGKEKGKGKDKFGAVSERRTEKATEIVNEDELPTDSEDLEGYWSEDSAFSDIVIGETEIEGDLVGEELFSDYIDESLINVINNTLNQSCSQTKVSGYDPLLNVDDVNVEIGSEDELMSDDDNRSVVGSDDELSSHDVFDPTVDFEKPILLKVGLLFPSVEVLRKAVRQHAIENGYEPYFLHNESARVSIQCRHRCNCAWNSKKSRLPKCTCGVKNPCLYRLTAAKVNGEDFTFEINTLYLDHICVYTTKNNMVTSEFIAEKYLETWRNDPGWSLTGTQSRVKLDYGVDVNYHKCWLARARAKLIIYGNSDEQYTRVWDYAHTIKTYNPGSSAFVMLCRIERPPPVFQRMYICLKACIDGFVKGCRPLVGVDGCHLKGMYPGMILVAVAMDGNNNIYPVAWAVVEVENRDSWKWFLGLLVSDIGMEEGAGVTFMSDRQKGLLDALKEVVPKAEIRFCVRHIWANFKLQFAGQAYKESFWKAPWATTQAEFKCALDEIKGFSNDAYNYVNQKCFKRIISESRYCRIHKAIDNKFEVDYKGGWWVVNLEEKTCSCKHWELVGIPCTHAMACILDQRRNPDDFVDDFYSRENYLLAYTPVVNPMPGVSQWERTDHVQPLPPTMRKMPGRPSNRKRKKEAGEASTGKKAKRTVKCGKCGALGHNIKSCKNAPSVPQSSKNKGGRPPNNSSWVKAAKKKNDAKKAKATHDQTILSQTGSQPSLD